MTDPAGYFRNKFCTQKHVLPSAIKSDKRLKHNKAGRHTTNTQCNVTSYAFLVSPNRATYPTKLIGLVYHIHNKICTEYKFRRSKLCSILQPPIVLNVFSPNILRSTMFPNTPNLWFSHNVRDQFSRVHEKQV